MCWLIRGETMVLTPGQTSPTKRHYLSKFLVKHLRVHTNCHEKFSKKVSLQTPPLMGKINTHYISDVRNYAITLTEDSYNDQLCR